MIPAGRPVTVTGPPATPKPPACCTCGKGRKGGWLCLPCFTDLDDDHPKEP